MVSATTAILGKNLPLYVKNVHNPYFFPESFTQLQTGAIWPATLILILLPTPKPGTFLVASQNDLILLIPFLSVPKYLPTPF